LCLLILCPCGRVGFSLYEMGCQGAKQIRDPSETQGLKDACHPILTQTTAEERALIQLWQIFNEIDRNGDGSVDESELAAALALDDDPWLRAILKEAGLNEQYNLFGTLDINKDGRVTWDEFEMILKSPAMKMEVKASGPDVDPQFPATEQALDYLRDVFEETHVNIDGTVLKEELAGALAADDGVANVIQEAGFNPKYHVLQPLRTIVEGRITWEEFEAHLHRGVASPKSAASPRAVNKPGEDDRVMVVDFL